LRPSILNEVVTALLETHRIQEAFGTAQLLHFPEFRGPAMRAVATAALSESSSYETASKATQEALTATKRITSDYLLVRNLTGLAELLVRLERPREAAEAAYQALLVCRSSAEFDETARALAPLKNGELGVAAGICINDLTHRTVFLSRLAQALAQRGQSEMSGRVAMEAYRSSKEIRAERLEALSEAAMALAAAGKRNEAERASGEAMEYLPDSGAVSGDLSACSVITDAFATIHSYRKARLCAEKCSELGYAIDAYTQILLAFIQQHHPERIALFLRDRSPRPYPGVN
jgi:tetratricopeptide (TPR) repeat protein